MGLGVAFTAASSKTDSRDEQIKVPEGEEERRTGKRGWGGEATDSARGWR